MNNILKGPEVERDWDIVGRERTSKELKLVSEGENVTNEDYAGPSNRI